MLAFPEIGMALVTRVMDAWPSRLPADELLEPNALAAISGDRLLRCLMQNCARETKIREACASD